MTSPGSVEADEQLRLFLALRLPEAALNVLDRWSARELSGGRRVVRDHLHVTLAFLGRRPASEVGPIVGELREAAARTAPPIFEIRRWRETRSVGMLVLEDTTGRSERLADDLHGRLERLGVYRREARPWLPHITTLRFRERPRLRPPLPEIAPFAPSDAAAFLSRLHPAGARYEVLESVPLGG